MNYRVIFVIINMRRFFFILCFLAFAGIAAAQPDTVTRRMERQAELFPQEKIYVQTDKSAYLSGERIWLRVHLADAATNRPVYRSRYVYVELINPFDEIVTRIMLRPDSLGVYAGHLDLGEELPEGSYTLRSYTRYMQNGGPESFFRKSISVLDPYSLELGLDSEFHYSEGGGLSLRLSFNDRRSGEAVIPELVTVRFKGKSTVTLKPREGRYTAKLPSDAAGGSLLVGIRRAGRRYQRYLSVPASVGDYDLALLPEGGYLIAGRACRVGVKAVGPDGFGLALKGVVKNSKGEEILGFGPLRKGMGSFSLRCEEGEKYSVECVSEDGSVRSFPLPDPEPGAHVLQIIRSGKNLFINKLSGAQAKPEQCLLLVHNCGQPLLCVPWEEDRSYYSVPVSDLPEGILGFMLLDSSLNVLSERLYFNRNGRSLVTPGIAASASSYGPREKVQVHLRLPSGTEALPMGVSVIDAGSALPEKDRSLLSELLLSSELRGFIEAPVEYFSAEDPADIDPLMLTQAWRRYDIPAVVKGDMEVPATEAERSQRISGKADGFVFTSVDGGDVSLYATLDSLSSVSTSRLSKDGRFRFDTEFPEGTKVTVQTRTRKGGKGNVLTIDSEEYPSSEGASLAEKAGAAVPDGYIAQADEDYLLTHGQRTTVLDAAVVSADRVQEEIDSKWYSPVTASEPLTGKEISEKHINSIMAVFLNTPGLVVRRGSDGQYLSSTRSTLPILPVVDDVVLPEYDLFSMTPEDIEAIFVIKDLTSVFGYYAGYSGAVVIKTSVGPDGFKKKSDNIAAVRPLGYQQKVEFYSPVYDTPEKQASVVPDLRTTIYWNPELEFNSAGEACAEFWTADKEGAYLLVGETLDSKGRVVRSELSITVGTR